ncbi:MAG: hypothetical protein KME54_23220 [Tolypothrix brevis GSE-NOS-MK-07-07A]|jgi:hypothetical protein|nr:hypothetical protein [Tolypothrix brevis GSE-NOS-MK-07-07A]
MDLATRIVDYMKAKNYAVFSGEKNYNIVYVEGMNEDGTLNDDAPNQFNDCRIIIEIVGNEPKIVNHWQATTEPGAYYTYNPMNEDGAARIKFGQYQAWKVGTHGNSEPHEALIQVLPVSIHRDFNKDFKRTGDRVDTGYYGINQHWGYDAPLTDIKNTSAGCLVGRRRQGHREFMKILKSDRRYQQSKDYIFYTTIIAGDDLIKN